ncbi:MAG: hypothetical protein C5B50_08090 [Verrucomicrobia bacterium]|nr:MAG: hypothetical protein C5B50_08090 [Verrucomicrobiota bacterium]
MKRFVKFLPAFLAAALLAPGHLGHLLAVTPPPTNSEPAKPSSITATDLFGDSVVAKGKGLQIKRSELDQAVSMQSQAGAQSQGIPTAQLDKSALDFLIRLHLLLAKATDSEKSNSRVLAQKVFDDLRARSGSEETINRQLRLAGLSKEAYLAQQADRMTADTVIRREIKVNVTDADARSFYETNAARFEQPEMVRISHILLSTRDENTGAELSSDLKAVKHKKAEDVLKRARAGEDFAKLADEFSEAPGAKQNHGEAKISHDDQSLPVEFKAAVFALSTNQVSEITTSAIGYHIFKLWEKIPAHKLKFDEVADNLKLALTNKAQQAELPHYLEKLWKEADVQILDEKLKK